MLLGATVGGAVLPGISCLREPSPGELCYQAQSDYPGPGCRYWETFGEKPDDPDGTEWHGILLYTPVPPEGCGDCGAAEDIDAQLVEQAYVVLCEPDSIVEVERGCWEELVFQDGVPRCVYLGWVQGDCEYMP